MQNTLNPLFTAVYLYDSSREKDCFSKTSLDFIKLREVTEWSSSCSREAARRVDTKQKVGIHFLYKSVNCLAEL